MVQTNKEILSNTAKKWTVKPWKNMEEVEMAITKWRGISEKAAQWAISMIGYFRKGKTVETVKTAVVASGWGKEDGEAGPRWFLRQLNYSL